MKHRLRSFFFELFIIFVVSVGGLFASFAVFALELETEISAQLEIAAGPDGNSVKSPGNAEFQALLSEKAFLREIYLAGGFGALWEDKEQQELLIELIGDADLDGLDPEDYHFSRLNRMASPSHQSSDLLAQRDILLTDAFARFAYHLRFGKANPLDIDNNWNFSRELITDNPALWMREAITGRELGTSLQWLRPNIQHYETLKVALARYRKIADEGQWPLVPSGPTLKPGMEDPRVSALRLRLISENYLAVAPVENSNLFDPELEKGVREYQRRQGLFEDGFVGKKTLDALNVPVVNRIEQIRVNLERIRWLFRDLEDEYIAVNIAAFQASYLLHDEVKWKGRAVVGRPYRQTPSFKATLTHMIFNPTWTIPPTILREDILPSMAKDQSYLSRKGLRVFDREGRAVEVSSIDWQQTTQQGFPYYIKQGPGPNNALGRIKFMFPNRHFIYLHDTPSQALFARAERTFSSGCIRLEYPFQLATTLLNRTENWLPSDIEKLVASGQPRRVDLDRPITVMMLYLTAFAAEDGQLELRRDIYKRDSAVLKALNGPFKFVPPKGYKLN